MQIRQAVPADLNAILTAYAHARQLMKDSGNPTQWGSTYPPEELTRADIAARRLYVVTEDDTVCGVFMFAQEADPCYAVIEDGAWLNDRPYGVIHRVASAGTHRGVLAAMLNWCAGQTDELRIDTHTDNARMRHLLAKYGFTECGTVYMEDGSPRIALHRSLHS